MITDITVTPINTIFKEPFKFSSGVINSLTSYIIDIKNENLYGYGEFCPWHTLNDKEIDFLNNSNNYIDIISKNNFENTFSPSLEYAISQALFELDLRTKYNNFTEGKTINLNGIISICNNEAEFRSCLQSLINKGFSCIKVKLNKDKVYVEKVLNILTNYPEITFRLDPNRSWNPSYLSLFEKEMQKINLEYIEEPCLSLSDNINIKDKFNVEVALDESVRDFSSALKLISNSPFKYFIIKPSTIGSISKNLSLIKLAKQSSKKIVISSMLENSIAHEYHCYLASKTGETFHGLATLFNIKNPVTPFGLFVSNKLNFNLDILKHDLMNDRLA